MACVLLLAGASVSGCAGTDVPDGAANVASDDSMAATDTPPAVDTAGAGPEGWQTASGIAYRQVRSLDLTGDGRNERVIASASGPAYDSLQVAITIEGERRDTLWHESWPSLLYFKYDPVEGKADTTIARVVRDHVEQLVAQDRFTTGGGLPPELRRGGDPAEVIRDAVRYHLAERSYRLNANLSPVDPTPPEAFSSINAEDVGAARVAAVIEEVEAAPSFMYFAGGEATYVIAWSEREAGFIRIYSCC